MCKDAEEVACKVPLVLLTFRAPLSVCSRKRLVNSPFYRSRIAGNWLFCNRRWLNPLKREDREKLERNYDKLCASFPVFALCPKNMFIHCVMDVTVAWTEVLVDTPRKTLAAAPHSSHALAPYNAPFPDTTPPFPQHAAPYVRHDRAPAHCFGMVWPGAAPAGLRAAVDCAGGFSPSGPADLSPADLSACSSPGSSPYDSADDGGAAMGDAELNAGEAMDMRLFRHWAASGPAALRVEAGELEQFGRSKSF